MIDSKRVDCTFKRNFINRIITKYSFLCMRSLGCFALIFNRMLDVFFSLFVPNFKTAYCMKNKVQTSDVPFDSKWRHFDIMKMTHHICSVLTGLVKWILISLKVKQQGTTYNTIIDLAGNSSAFGVFLWNSFEFSFTKETVRDTTQTTKMASYYLP